MQNSSFPSTLLQLKFQILEYFIRISVSNKIKVYDLNCIDRKNLLFPQLLNLT
jgi:hypothetical protein